MNIHSNPRVLHIASGDLWAGAEVQLFTLAKTLHCKLNASVSVILLNHGTLEEKLRELGIDVLILDESRMNGLQILRSLIHSIKKLNPDIIHSHRVKENILGSIAALLAGQVPSLRTVHGAPEHRPSWRQPAKHLIRYLDWLVGRVLQSRIIAVSEDLALLLEKSFPPGKIRIIENGIDIQSIQHQLPLQSRVQSRFPGTIKIGLAGRLVPVKRVDLFLQIARYILEHHPELKTSFHIYGDGPMRHELENLSKESGTEGILHFEGHCDDMPRRLRGLNALLMTSDHEGLPMILLEAMALQVPIIAHAVGGIPRLLDNGTCGALVEVQNAHSYAHEILRLHQSPQIFSDFSKNALKRVQSNYSAEHNAVEYLSVYSEIIQGNI